MSGFQKNVTGQKWLAFAFNRTDSTPTTGDAANITAKIRKDFGTATATNDANPTEIEDGYYEFDLTQAETNADVLDLLPESSTSDIQVIGISGRVFTVPANFSALGIETDGDLTKVNTLDGHTAQTGNSFARLGAPAGASVSADVAAAKVDTAAILVDTATLGAPAGASHAADIAAIKAETVLIVADTGELQTDWVDGGRLDLIVDAILVDTATLGVPAGASHAADIAAVKVDTAATLVDTATLGAPAGASHAADIAAIKAETVSIVADTGELQTDWVNGGRLDLIVDAILVDTATLGAPAGASHAADIAAVKVDTAATLVDTATLGAPAGASHAADIAAIKVDTAATLVDTAELGAAGAGLTALPWNSAWDTEVQSECSDAMVAFGLDHLVSVAVVGADVANNSIIAKLASKSSTADWDDFANTTDSLQAIADASTPPTAAAIADAVWDEAIAGHVAAGSFGIQCGTDIDAILVDTATLGTPAGASHAADIAAVKVDTAAILVDTADMQPKLGTPASDIAADVAAVKVDTAATLVDTATLGAPAGASHAADIAAIKAETAAIVVDLADGTVQVGTIQDGAIGSAVVTDIFATSTIAEAYPGKDVAATPGSILYCIMQHLNDAAIVSTTKTVRKFDGSAALTITLDDATTPTDVNRAT